MSVNLSKQVGPLPLGAWVVVVGAGLGIAYYTRGKSAAAPASTNTDPNATQDYTGGYPGVGGILGAATDSGTAAVGTGTNGVAPPPATNDDWSHQAINGLIALGYDPNISDSAVRKYMEGAQLSATEYALIAIALAHFGPPPVTLPAPVFGPPTVPNPHPTSGGKGGGSTHPTPHPTPKPVPSPVSVKHYKVVSGDTLWAIARKEYGNPLQWTKIWKANKAQIHNPNQIHPGQVLVIPR